MAVKESVSVVAGFTPIDGIKDAGDFITGKDVITGKKINRVILGIMIFTPEVIDKGLRGFAKSGKNVAEETLEAGIKNSIQESSEATIKRGVKNGVQESSEVAIKRGIKKSDELVEASTGIRFADNIDDYGKVNIPELPKNAVQKNYLEVTRTGNNVSSGVGNGNTVSGIDSRYLKEGYQSGARSNNLFAKDKFTKNTEQLTEWRRSIDKSDIANERRLFLGEDYVKVSEGKWRSLDGTRQFRVKPDDYLGGHGIGMPTVPNTPHVHFEFLQPKGNKFEVIKNIHVPLQ